MNTTLDALVNLAEAKHNKLTQSYQARIRVNQVGDAVEYFVKDMYADAFGITDKLKKLEQYQRCFSWLGNQNNPPDFIIRKGDAVEVKKTIGDGVSLALNISYPKDYLWSDDTRIVRDCVMCEDDIGAWKKKNMVYAVAHADENEIKSLWLVYGDCFAAKREIYLSPTLKIQNALSEAEGIELTDTKELAKIKKIDPLGITDLRVRGMWSISSPRKVFSAYVNDINETIHCVMQKVKYQELLEMLDPVKRKKFDSFYKVADINVPNPNNPAKTIPSVIIVGYLHN